MRRVRKARRGLSAIITTAILLTATVMMGTGLVNWSHSNLASYQQSISNTYTNNANQLNENLVVENVWFGSNPSKFLNVTITNIGFIGLNVTDIKIINSGSTSDYHFSHTSIFPNKQNSTLLYYNWTSGMPLQLVVTTARGAIFTSQVMSP